MSRTFMLWMLWLSLAIPATLFVVAAIVYGGHRSFLLIGKTTSGHHQIELACDSCHTSVFGGAELLQDACVNCHGAELKAANDAHPKSKFTDPRNADRTAVLDARYCVTCHQEHRPKITQTMGVTLPNDFCFKCHQDVDDDRPSHKDLSFTTCASAGCHNFHDNRALYLDFLVKHAGQPAHLDVQKVGLIDFLKSRDKAITVPKALLAADADAPAQHRSETAVADWLKDDHSRAGVNCSDCHGGKGQTEWVAAPAIDTCKGCHAAEAATFVEGKHGMRLREGLYETRKDPFGLFADRKLSAMTPAQARLSMKPDAAHAALGCNSCHSAHAYDTQAAKVESCAGCHDDAHSRAYFASPHYELFKKEAAGTLPRGSGVTCATCHMPVAESRDADGRKIHFTNHNQNDNLRPNEKMVRSVCGDCHGLQFTLNALADPELILRNFAGQTSVHIESIEWAEKRVRDRMQRGK